MLFVSYALVLHKRDTKASEKKADSISMLFVFLIP